MAAELKDSFTALAPIPWTSVPHDDLTTFLREAYHHAEILVNSIPISSTHPPTNGTPTTPPPDHANSATKGLGTFFPAHPTNIDARNAAIQKAWGKPLKLGAKENPLGVSVYKTAAHDRHGAWFARRSVHAGLGFTRWRRAMGREFVESLKVKGGPGAGAVRGIAGDKRLEKQVVEGVGKVEVWQLSSAFPGPVTPRGFFEVIMSSDNVLSEASSTSEEPSSEHIPRHYVIISRPTTYEDATPNTSLVYGTYESVEMIREIPDSTVTDPEMNPVEWVMITRSDPGGGIPKFMVERGTPGSIVADVPKFLDWAIKQGDVPEIDEAAEDAEIEKVATAGEVDEEEADATKEAVQGDSEAASRDATVERKVSLHPDDTTSDSHGHSTLLGSLTSAVGATVSGYLPYFRSTAPGAYPDDDEDASDSVSVSSSSSSTGTFASAPELRSNTDGIIRPQSTRSLDLATLRDGGRKPTNSHERELVKLSERRAAIEERLAKVKEEDERKTAELHEKEEVESAKTVERREKERKKAEERYRREMEKLDERRVKEERKMEEIRLKEDRRAEERRRKAIEKDAVLKAQRERDEAREKLDVATRENEVMRSQIEELQRENTLLVQKLGATGEAGVEAVRKVREEAANRSRTSSRASRGTGSSHKSKESKEVGLAGDQA